jgi:hypothetical protein
MSTTWFVNGRHDPQKRKEEFKLNLEHYQKELFIFKICFQVFTYKKHGLATQMDSNVEF